MRFLSSVHILCYDLNFLGTYINYAKKEEEKKVFFYIQTIKEGGRRMDYK